MNGVDIIGGMLLLVVMIYIMLALVKPERFQTIIAPVKIDELASFTWNFGFLDTVSLLHVVILHALI